MISGTASYPVFGGPTIVTSLPTYTNTTTTYPTFNANSMGGQSNAMYNITAKQSIPTMQIKIGKMTVDLQTAFDLYGNGIVSAAEVRLAIADQIKMGLDILPHLSDLVSMRIWSQDEARLFLGLESFGE